MLRCSWIVLLAACAAPPAVSPPTSSFDGSALVLPRPEGVPLPPAVAGIPAQSPDHRLFPDRDGDGVGAAVDGRVGPGVAWVARDGDCDDADPTVFPGAAEVCDGVDQDCDGLVNEEAVDAPTYYVDADGDGSGDPAQPVASCQLVEGLVRTGFDCDDADADVFPGAAETWYDGVDSDCDPVNEFDADGDGSDAADWGGGDCDDRRAAVNPAATEVCDHRDNNCDGAIDEAGAEGAMAAFVDADGDGFGGEATAVCTMTAGMSLTGGDCDDTDAAVSPVAVERWYDGVDQDCDGANDQDADGDGIVRWESGGLDCDDADPAHGVEVWYTDGDGDGVGLTSSAAQTCAPGAADVTVPGDCDDAEARVSPGLAEVCGDGLDNDCSGDRGGCGVFQSQSTADAVAAVLGTSAGGRLGAQLAALSDVDGDGVDEVVVGAPSLSTGTSRVGGFYVMPSDFADGDTTADALGALSGTTKDQALGGRLLNAGDLDGDGYEDLIVGREPLSGVSDGGLWMVSGPLQGALSLGDGLRGQTGDTLGAALVGGADLSGDGVADLLFSATGRDDGGLNAGAIYLFTDGLGTDLSEASARVLGVANQGLGVSLALLDDYDGDGAADLVTTTLTGAVLVFSGPLAGDLAVADADASLTGLLGGGSNVVTGLGDLDGDGLTDLGIGSPRAGGTKGAAYLITGAPTGSRTIASAARATLQGSTGAAFLGTSLTPAGDLDADGVGELIVGAPGNSTSSRGAVYLFAGPVTGTLTETDAVGKITGASTNMMAGDAVLGGHDFDGDGVRDLLVGASVSDDGSKDGGALYFFSGASAL